MTISGKSSKTDWERVKRDYDSDAPIPFDPEDGPYDPNDEAATEACLNAATVWAGWPNPVMIQKDGVPVVSAEKEPSVEGEPRAKAS
jgi:hypothetical protein